MSPARKTAPKRRPTVTSTQEKARWNTELGNQKTRMPVSGTAERRRMILKGGIVLSMDPDVGDPVG